MLSYPREPFWRAEKSAPEALASVRGKFPTWALTGRIGGTAGLRFTRAHLLDLHRAELTVELREQFKLEAPAELPFPPEEAALGPGIPSGDELSVWRSGGPIADSLIGYGHTVNWQFAGELLRRAAELGEGDVESRIRETIQPPDPADIWQRRTRLEIALREGADITDDWHTLQQEVLAAYGLDDLPVGVRRAMKRLLPDFDPQVATAPLAEAKQLAEYFLTWNCKEVSEEMRLALPCFSRRELEALIDACYKGKNPERAPLAVRLNISREQLSELLRTRLR